MVAGKRVKRLFGAGVLGKDAVDAPLPVHAPEHGVRLVEELLHVRAVGTEHKILAVGVQMSLEDDVQPVRLFQGAPQRLQILLPRVAHFLRTRGADEPLVFCELPSAVVERRHIDGRGEDAAGDRLAERHAGGDVPAEEFLRHVALVVEIADIGGGKTQNGHARTAP